jgi:polyisoprenoid-binding protein YceI
MRSIAVLTAFFASSLAAAQSTTWNVDSAHSSIVFKINHMGFSNVHGMFPGLEGTVMLDDAHPDKSSFDLKVPADKVATFMPKRDDHLKGPDFFNVKQFPTIELKSKSVKKNGDNYNITADLTMHGVTKPVNFTFHRMKTGKGPDGAPRTGGETMFKIKRGDFGVNFMNKPGELGDEVELTVNVEATQK